MLVYCDYYDYYYNNCYLGCNSAISSDAHIQLNHCKTEYKHTYLKLTYLFTLITTGGTKRARARANFASKWTAQQLTLAAAKLVSTHRQLCVGKHIYVSHNNWRQHNSCCDFIEFNFNEMIFASFILVHAILAVPFALHIACKL